MAYKLITTLCIMMSLSGCFKKIINNESDPVHKEVVIEQREDPTIVKEHKTTTIQHY